MSELYKLKKQLQKLRERQEKLLHEKYVNENDTLELNQDIMQIQEKINDAYEQERKKLMKKKKKKRRY